MGTQRVQMKGVLPWLVLGGLSCQYKRFLFSLGCSSQPSTNIFFLTIHFFNSFVSVNHQAGQAAVLGRLSLSMSLWVYTVYDSRNDQSHTSFYNIPDGLENIYLARNSLELNCPGFFSLCILFCMKYRFYSNDKNFQHKYCASLPK